MANNPIISPLIGVLLQRFEDTPKKMKSEGRWSSILKGDLLTTYKFYLKKKAIMREGSHITIVAFSKAVDASLQAAKELESLGVSAEVINLRTLRPLDFETIKNSVMKTHHLVTVEQCWPYAGIGAEICAQVTESRAWDYLDAPILRVTGVDIPMPYAQHLEELALPDASCIVATCKKSLNISEKISTNNR
ncbi:Pyruvate dehydrogenase E1 component subunit beta, mitochondrial [Parelaphostrongylus tenuis]|uniref:Pyruvate dehydrogenase E1 component subunit beta, mitochondrial n=1 Tax=Parelaphostrongylus tenuis TaxID=148309 RepID=A0AAD5MQ14_PARTN|nr:Pyruvate dehydrogenase E1 component subunit beta, mitochondrial [Parelaphostrongylus tenuis]